MAPVPSIRVVKSMDFKGGTRLYGNRYHFAGGVPADFAHWTTLADAVVDAEKAIHSTFVTITQAVGYLAGSDVPVATIAYGTAGTLASPEGAYIAPGECAALLRYSTDARTSKNHPIYLFNYFHHIFTNGGSDHCDELETTNAGAIDDYASAWIAGFSDGTHTLHRAGPNGDLAVTQFVEGYVTHRDFPYTPSA